MTKDERPRAAIDAIRKYKNGEITKCELRYAADDADDDDNADDAADMKWELLREWINS